MRIDKFAMTAQAALQEAVGVASDSEASEVTTLHLLKALLESSERNLDAIIARVEERSNSEANETTGMPPCALFMDEKDALLPIGNARALECFLQLNFLGFHNLFFSGFTA